MEDSEFSGSKLDWSADLTSSSPNNSFSNNVSSSSSKNVPPPPCSKQEEIREKIRLAQVKIEIAKSLNCDNNNMMALILEKSKLESDLRKLILNQERQRRFRDRKRQQKQQQKQENSPKRASSSTLQEFQDYHSDQSTSKTTTPDLRPQTQPANSHIIEIEPSFKIVQFSEKKWKELEQQHPLLVACPLIGEENSEPLTPTQKLQHIGEVTFLERVEKLGKTNGLTAETAVEGILQMVQIRKAFLKDSLHYGTAAARNFLCMSLTKQRPLTDQEKLDYLFGNSPKDANDMV